MAKKIATAEKASVKPVGTIIPTWMVSQYLRGNFSREKIAKYLCVTHSAVDRALLKQGVKKPKASTRQRDPEIVKRDARVIQLHKDGMGYLKISEQITKETGNRIGKHRVEQIVREYKYNEVKLSDVPEMTNRNPLMVESDKNIKPLTDNFKSDYSLVVHTDPI